MLSLQSTHSTNDVLENRDWGLSQYSACSDIYGERTHAPYMAGREYRVHQLPLAPVILAFISCPLVSNDIEVGTSRHTQRCQESLSKDHSICPIAPSTTRNRGGNEQPTK